MSTCLQGLGAHGNLQAIVHIDGIMRMIILHLVLKARSDQCNSLRKTQ